MTIELFALMQILLVHYLIDWCWQTQFIAEHKRTFKTIMFAHVFTWTLGITTLLALFGIFAWWKVLFLFAGHWAADKQKADLVYFYRRYDHTVDRTRYLYERERDKYFGKLLFKDQLFHFAQIAIVFFL